MMRNWRRAIIQKPDLDTCLAGLLLGAPTGSALGVVRDQVSPEELADPTVLCLECGGSGQVAAGNFDHHDTTEALPPACVQALAVAGGDAATRRLVAYVAAVDVGAAPLTAAPPHLSGLFAGMLLCTPDLETRFRVGMDLLRRILELDLDPGATLPPRPEWAEWLAAKAENEARVRDVVATAQIGTTAGGRRFGFVQTSFYGALGALYAQGCEVAVAYNPAFGEPPVPKYTIGTQNVPLAAVCAALLAREPGWGGPAHGTILGSPRAGSRLLPDDVLAIVRAAL